MSHDHCKLAVLTPLLFVWTHITSHIGITHILFKYWNMSCPILYVMIKKTRNGNDLVLLLLRAFFNHWGKAKEQSVVVERNGPVSLCSQLWIGQLLQAAKINFIFWVAGFIVQMWNVRSVMKFRVDGASGTMKLWQKRPATCCHSDTERHCGDTPAVLCWALACDKQTGS